MCRMFWNLIWGTSSFISQKAKKLKREGKSAIWPNWFCQQSITVLKLPISWFMKKLRKIYFMSVFYWLNSSSYSWSPARKRECMRCFLNKCHLKLDIGNSIIKNNQRFKADSFNYTESHICIMNKTSWQSATPKTST